MITLILLIILVISTISFTIHLFIKEGVYDIIFQIILYIFGNIIVITLFSVLIINIMSNINVYNKQSKIYIKNIIPIVSLNNNIGIKGSFFLGTGTINSIEYFYMFREYNNNSYKRYKLNASKCVIIENNKINPQVKEYYKLYKYNNILIYSYLDIFKKCDVFYYYEIIVPKNTIIQQFTLK